MSDGKQIFCQILPQGSIINVLKGVNDMNNDLISIAKLNELFSKKIDSAVAHACNPSTLGGRGESQNG